LPFSDMNRPDTALLLRNRERNRCSALDDTAGTPGRAQGDERKIPAMWMPLQ
jgi:hypothetical protein